MTQPVFRFAPSPNGRLHLGHAYSAILNHDMAKASGGRFLVRIEDIDTVRCKPEFINAALDDLHWLGLEWEQPVRRQSEHFADYEAALGTLKEHGLIYPAFMTRTEIVAATGKTTPRDPDGSPLYPGNERTWSQDRCDAAMATGIPFGWRLDMKKACAQLGARLHWEEMAGGRIEKVSADPSQWGDVLLARKDMPTSYHLSVVVDDAIQGVTDIVRGKDLYQATAIHRLLQELLGSPAPRYFHHDLVLDETGSKLAKSMGSTALAQLRQQGIVPDGIREMLGLGVRQTG